MRPKKSGILQSSSGFNPRTPCGVRLESLDATPRRAGFNPRTPCGVRLDGHSAPEPRSDVSIHALLAECDMMRVRQRPDVFGFNPRTPCGVRLNFHPGGHDYDGFNPRTPCGVRPVSGPAPHCHRAVSIHALLAECDVDLDVVRVVNKCFNPRTPCGVRRSAL